MNPSVLIKPEEEGVANRFVAMIDILGFRDLVTSRSLDDVVELLTSLVGRAEYPGPTSVYLENNGAERTVDVRLRARVFSDTIFIWTAGVESSDQDAPVFLQTIAEAVAELILHAFLHGVPLRAGISYGESYVGKLGEVIAGRVVIEAHETESEQEWIGGALHPNCPTFGLEDHTEICLTTYKVPVKESARLKLAVAVDWTKPVMDSMGWYPRLLKRRPPAPPWRLPPEQLKLRVLRLARRRILEQLRELHRLAPPGGSRTKYENARRFVRHQPDGTRGSPLDIPRSQSMEILLPGKGQGRVFEAI